MKLKLAGSRAQVARFLRRRGYVRKREAVKAAIARPAFIEQLRREISFAEASAPVKTLQQLEPVVHRALAAIGEAVDRDVVQLRLRWTPSGVRGHVGITVGWSAKVARFLAEEFGVVVGSGDVEP